MVIKISLATVIAAYCLQACGLQACGQPPTPAQVAAESAYTASLLMCVEKSTTLAESKACRAEVDRSWGIVQTVSDGGR